MPESDPDDVTLNTIHQDLTAGFGEMRTGFGELKGEIRSGFADLKGEMRAGFADLKTTMIAGFRGMPSRESSDETVRLLREANRLNEGRFTEIDARIRDQHTQTLQLLHAIAERQDRTAEGLDRLAEAQRLLVEGQNSLSADIKALIARIDAMIRGRGNGEPPG